MNLYYIQETWTLLHKADEMTSIVWTSLNLVSPVKDGAKDNDHNTTTEISSDGVRVL